MIVVESFVKTTSGDFLPFGAAGGAKQELDLIEGAIEVTVGDALLLGSRNWDYIFPLWAYLAAALKDFRETGEGTLRFPDQPVGLSIRRVTEGVRLQVRGDGPDREAVASEPQFVQAVRARGEEFFRTAITLSPGERSIIERILDRLLSDPPGSVLANVHWEQRLSTQQVAALRHAERVTGRRFTPQEREEIISRVAGRRGTFEEYVTIAMKESRDS